jgi:uncharacterized protein YidB (DUF937 family)
VSARCRQRLGPGSGPQALSRDGERPDPRGGQGSQEHLPAYGPRTWSFTLVGAARCFGKGCRCYLHQSDLRGLFLLKGLEKSMDVNALVKKVTSGAQGNHGTLSTVMGLMGGQNQAGFSNMVSSLTSGGLGDQVKSWVGTGVNQVVSSQQVASWLGNDKLQQVGRSVGLSPNDVASHLAQQLPAFIDKLTPHGSVPDEAGLENAAGQIVGQ